MKICLIQKENDGNSEVKKHWLSSLNPLLNQYINKLREGKQFVQRHTAFFFFPARHEVSVAQVWFQVWSPPRFYIHVSNDILYSHCQANTILIIIAKFVESNIFINIKKIFRKVTFP
jgi:hypothetical protein